MWRLTARFALSVVLGLVVGTSLAPEDARAGEPRRALRTGSSATLSAASPTTTFSTEVVATTPTPFTIQLDAPPSMIRCVVRSEGPHANVPFSIEATSPHGLRAESLGQGRTGSMLMVAAETGGPWTFRIGLIGSVTPRARAAVTFALVRRLSERQAGALRTAQSVYALQREVAALTQRIDDSAPPSVEPPFDPSTLTPVKPLTRFDPIALLEHARATTVLVRDQLGADLIGPPILVTMGELRKLRDHLNARAFTHVEHRAGGDPTLPAVQVVYDLVGRLREGTPPERLEALLGRSVADDEVLFSVNLLQLRSPERAPWKEAKGASGSVFEFVPFPSDRLAPVAAYDFNEPSGSQALDGSGNGHTATIDGAVRVPGRRGTGLHFDGQGAHVALPTLNGGALFAGVTLDAWIRLDTVALDEQDILMLDSANGFVNIAVYGDSVVFAIDRVPGASQAGATASHVLTEGRWVRVTGTYDGATLKLYIDGRLAASQDAPGTLRSGRYTNIIGRRSNANLAQTVGAIDDVRVYARALTAEELALAE